MPTTKKTTDLTSRLSAVEHTDDVVEYTVRCLVALAPDLEEALAQAADRQVREVFGRCKVYVPVRPGDVRSQTHEAIRLDYQRGERVPCLARKYGLSERTVWRIVSPLQQAA